MTSLDVSAIRARTRVALPEDDSYLYRLGVALYGFAYVNSFMTEIISHLDPAKDRTSLGDLTSGQVLIEFKGAAARWTGAGIEPSASDVADGFARLNEERTDFVHSGLITNGAHEQILHRRKDKVGKYFEVTNKFLDDFIGRLTTVADGLYAIRATVRPQL